MEQAFDDRIDAYLNGRLNATELQEFEAEMAQNTQLRQAVQRGRMADAAVGIYGRHRLQELAAEARIRIGTPAEPQITWLDRLRYTLLYQPLNLVVAAIVVVVVATVLYANLAVQPVQKLQAALAFPPADRQVAGAPMNAAQIFQRAGDWYWLKQPDSLLALAGRQPEFTMADYYLAHRYLIQTGEPEKALTYFDKTLQNRSYVEAYVTDFGKIKFNRLLALLGTQGGKAAKAALPALLQDPDVEGEAKKRAQELQDKLSDPLRILRFVP